MTKQSFRTRRPYYVEFIEFLYFMSVWSHTIYIFTFANIFFFLRCMMNNLRQMKKNIWWIDYSVAFTRYVNHFSPLNTIFFFFIRLFLLIYFISTYQLHHYLPTWFPPLSSLKYVYFPFCFHLIPEFLW